MRIIGGHDYYDSALSMGIDPTIKLIRGKSKSIPAEAAGGTLLPRALELSAPFSQETFSVRSVAVAFCGKVYRGALGTRGGEKPEGFWDAGKLVAWVQKTKNSKVKIMSSWPYGRKTMTLEEYFTPAEASETLRDYMIKNKISILVDEGPDQYNRPGDFQVNPFTLKQLGFARAVDPFTAFQELSMWIGGVLGGTSPEIVTIKDDKVLIQNHGFDKFSFRGPRLA